ncbi:hypothetical protein GQ43DRAFT_6554 [Delitschia confertaspora ATCC 74209]|uniref:Uncharacterized protein n=1 Tax=Delitschia confertaspora ATCC 74209 TaxID=1513339 RepID=A0A9P4JS23_9PLEO|nr:hypothetical protein GQ43DRAFT_6554 [Delitschia confertaspora ATCC 74209]
MANWPRSALGPMDYISSIQRNQLVSNPGRQPKTHLSSLGPVVPSAGRNRFFSEPASPVAEYTPALGPISPPPSADIPQDITSPYKPYKSCFEASDQANAHRISARRPPKPKDSNFEQTKQRLREYWARAIYKSIVDASSVNDLPTSTQYKRFVTTAAYEQEDFEAAAHKVFDRALDVYERGWQRP